MFESVWEWIVSPENLRLLLGVSIAFTAGLLISGWSKRATDKSSASKGDEAFFKGIQYILSNDHDHAIEEFTKSVKVNSDTVETYVALGNLYRSKGDIDRAIRIRQNLILRPQIDERIRIQALFDLGLDYRTGGFLNRALGMFLKVIQKDPANVEALERAERIYEEMEDWNNAYRVRHRISRLTREDHRNRLAHHLVELGKGSAEKGDTGKAVSLYNKAISTDKNCVDAYLHLGDVYLERGDHKKALSAWKKIVHVAPRFTFLAYRRLEASYATIKDLKPVEDFLKECSSSNPDAFTHMAMARYLYNENDTEGSLRELDDALELNPDFWEARRFRGQILLEKDREAEALEDYEELIEHLTIPYLRFQCSECGFQANELVWQCPQCKNWDTINLKELKAQLPKTPDATDTALPDIKPAVPEH